MHRAILSIRIVPLSFFFVHRKTTAGENLQQRITARSGSIGTRRANLTECDEWQQHRARNLRGPTAVSKIPDLLCGSIASHSRLLLNLKNFQKMFAQPTISSQKKNTPKS